MIKRLFGAALLALALVASVVPAVALAVEDTAPQEGEPLEGATPEGEVEEEAPSIGEIGTDVARSEFFPEEYVSPTWFQWVLYPTLAIGVVMALGLLLYYLFRQPDFARERREKSRR
jgi:hypothetical protein